MNPGRYFIPNMGMAPMMRMGAGFGINPVMRANYLASGGSNLLNSRGIGLFSRIANGVRSFNWSGLLNGANRTLNVVNQTIPLIRQARPMVNNVKSMLQLAKAFGSETNNKKISNINDDKPKNNDITIVPNNEDKEIVTKEKEVMNNNYPNFFI